MKFPSFEPVADSPEIDDLGVAIRLGAPVFSMDEPVALYGSYFVDGEFLQKSYNEPLTWILLIVIRRDKPAVWSKRVLEKPNLAPIPEPDKELPDPSFRIGGYFNLDLRDHLRLPSEPGKYWLIVTMGEYATERVSFEIRGK